MSSPPPKHSLSSPTSGGSPSPVLPTPSSSSSASEVTNQLRRELEQQIAEKEKQLQDSTSGIGKSVIARQISQLKERLQEVDKRQPVSPNPIRRSQSPAEEDLSPATLEKLRNLERDLSAYRGYQQLSPSLSSSRKDKLLGQRSSGLDPLPSPSTSTMLPPAHGRDSPSLLPLPPPPTGSTPTKRRSKVPNADRRNTDIEFATEIGQGLLIEVRKMQALLQEKEDQLKQLEAQKADLERAAESMAKQLRQKEENEEKLKEETWNLELAKQELTTTVTELQQNLSKSNAEQKRMQDHMDELTSEIEHMRDKEERLAATVEAMKQKHEHDMANLRRHSAGLQREKADFAKQVEALSSELAIAKAQSRIAKKSQSDLRPAAAPADPREEQTQSTAGPSKEGSTPGTTPPPSPKQTPSRNQALEVETLKSSLAHAHRMVSNLRSNLHKEKTEKFELKKLLSEYQETIEQLQNDPRLWVDTGYPKSGSGGGGASQEANGGSGAHRRHRKGKRRVPVSKTSVARYSKGVESLDDSSDVETRRKRKDSQLASYYSSSDDSEYEEEEYEDADDTLNVVDSPNNHQFESLSSELSKSQRKQEAAEAPRTLGDELSAAFSSSPEKTAIAAGAAGLAAGSVLESSSSTQPAGVDTSTQTDDNTTPQISTQEIAVQTDDVEKKEFSQVQTSTVDIAPAPGHDAETQCVAVATVDAAMQSEQLPGIDQYIQCESATYSDSSVQCEPVQTLDQSVQHSIQSIDSSVQSDPPAVAETVDASSQYDLVRATKDAEVQVALEASSSDAAAAVLANSPRRESGSSSDHTAAVATAGAAGVFGLGALAARAFGGLMSSKSAEPQETVEKDRAVKQNDADRSVTPAVLGTTSADVSEQPASPQEAAEKDSATKDDEADQSVTPAAPATEAIISSQGAVQNLSNRTRNDDAQVKDETASKQEQDVPSPSQVASNDAAAAAEQVDQEATSPVPSAEKKASSTTPAVAAAAATGAAVSPSTAPKEMTTPVPSINKDIATNADDKAVPTDSKGDAKVYSKAETDAMIAAAVADALAKANANAATDKNNAAGKELSQHQSSQSNVEADDKPTSSDLAARESAAEGVPVRPVSPPPTHLLSRLSHAPSNRSSVNSTVDKGKAPVRVLRSAPAPPPVNDEQAASLMSSVSTSEPRASFGSSAYDGSMRNQGDGEAGPIALVTQTMIGDWMWKYTRNAVGSGLSDHRHRRFFWVHPYTRTLYWSPNAPGNPRNQTKTKSALIEGVSVIPDNNSAPAPGVPNVSLLIKTSGRVIKLTAPNMDRHNIWLESLSYLLTRGANHQDTKSIGFDTTSSSAATRSLSHRPSMQGLQHYFRSGSKHSEQAAAQAATAVGRDDDSEDEALEDVRMCCDGKHHVSKLERDHIHQHRPYYRKRQSRQPLKG